MNTVTFPLASCPRPVALRTALAAALISVIATMPANAATSGREIPQVVVRYADLNLETDEGALTLYRRIAGAARQVCPDYSTRDLQRLQMVRACRDQAMARAIKAVGNEKLAALQAARSSRNRVS